ncbi:Gp19/Gp15/Gp42 family protein [Pseudokineococcus lusitanus]|uniref:Gp19/Gp15/Gp42-like protein n=1 Tax=Pseudokineococcus lusitanus TaxID=763993 RepID=A0A3N1HTT1_9ACTN|nr:Gp19/Gp15/Gp42 family protein [Pseudokineococcus lusitanus]ROP45944.1 Gp19/Gp15/Gp42-like protein [Pseudokineococcus lusitanus]
MAALATAEDVSRLWRQLTPAEGERATGLLEFATAKLRQLLPEVDSWLDQGLVDRDLARMTVAEAVRRVLANPHGARAESIDDYSYTRDGSLASGELHFTDAELLSLRPTSVTYGGAGGAFTIMPGRWA